MEERARIVDDVLHSQRLGTIRTAAYYSAHTRTYLSVYRLQGIPLRILRRTYET